MEEWESGCYKNSNRMIRVNKVNLEGYVIKTYRSVSQACKENKIGISVWDEYVLNDCERLIRLKK